VGELKGFFCAEGSQMKGVKESEEACSEGVWEVPEVVIKYAYGIPE